MVRKKVGLFFGSFNPIHIGHIIIANHFVEFSNLNEVWFVVSPQNPFKEKKSLLAQNLRLEMVHLALAKYLFLKASDVEFQLPQPSYTIHTLLHLAEKFPDLDFQLIMGSDNLENFHKWKNYSAILDSHDLYVYPRPSKVSKPIDIKILGKTTFLEAPQLEISSTHIRSSIKENKNIRPLLPPEVFDYMNGSNFYKG